MPLYFFVYDEAFFCGNFRSALSACWRQKSFRPCENLCAQLLVRAENFIPESSREFEESLCARVVAGLTFNPLWWQTLVGEALLYGAKKIPELETAPDTLARLVPSSSSERNLANRAEASLLAQAHYGARELVLGGRFYRPDHLGFNDREDIERLADYLHSLEPENWRAADLLGCPGVDEENCEEELAFVLDWFPALRELYSEARTQREIILCEEL